MVGSSRSANGTEAFIWTENEGMKGLGDLSGGIFYSNANGVSADGSTVDRLPLKVNYPGLNTGYISQLNPHPRH